MSDSKQNSALDPDGIRSVAVIDIGATSVRMAIAEITSSGSVRPLESVTKPVHLAKIRSLVGDCVAAPLKSVLPFFGVTVDCCSSME